MKKLIISLVLAMALIGAVFGAAAALNVTGVDNLGSGTEVVTSGSDLATDDAAWVLDTSDNSKVHGVILKFDLDVADSSSINVQVRQDNCNGTILAQSTISVTGILTALAATEELVFVNDANPAAAAIDCLQVTVIQPN